MSIRTRLISSEHGFDDYDVAGLPKVHRVCIGHGIKKDDIFNVFCDDGVKLGGYPDFRYSPGLERLSD